MLTKINKKAVGLMAAYVRKVAIHLNLIQVKCNEIFLKI